MTYSARWEVNGTLRDFVSWDDLRAPATALKVGSTAPSANTDYGWLEFAHNANAFVFHLFQMPHSWKEGSPIKPHVHWMKTTSAAGNVEWKLEYRWIPIRETMDSSWTAISNETPAVSDGDTQYQHALTPFGSVDCTGKQVSDMILIKLTRLGTGYTGSSHYTAPAALLELDIHYQIDSFGSIAEYSK